jgi:hypothetical protein
VEEATERKGDHPIGTSCVYYFLPEVVDKEEGKRLRESLVEAGEKSNPLFLALAKEEEYR